MFPENLPLFRAGSGQSAAAVSAWWWQNTPMVTGRACGTKAVNHVMILNLYGSSGATN